ncbi:MAG: competence/damage-inducible protein A [Rickettsiales bacterium]
MKNQVTASLVIIGNEILSGRTQDKNLAYIAHKLNEKGIQLREVRVVPDIEAEIVDAINAVRKRYDYVFTTGGIGPTHDDITTESVAKAFGVKTYRHPEAEAALRSYIPAERINEARLKMADVPVGAELVPNPVSAAPGFHMENVFVMAGIPNIMQAMLEAILPLLKSGVTMQSISLTTDLPEGTIADGLTQIQNRYPNIDVGSYPRFVDGRGITTLVFRSSDTEKNTQAAQELRQLVSALNGNIIHEPT